MVILPVFRMAQYKVNDHPYDTPQFMADRVELTSVRENAE